MLNIFGRLTGCELSDSLGALRHSMLGKLSRQDEPDSSLDLTGCDCWLLVIASQLGGFGGDFVEDIVDEGVQDRHGL